MFQRNLRYFEGLDDVDNWVNISKEVYEAILDYCKEHASTKGLNVDTYMDFVKEAVVREI